MFKNSTAAQFEGKVDVSHLEAKEDSDKGIVEKRIHRAHVTFAGSVEPISADDISFVLTHEATGLLQFNHVERKIGIGIQHQITRHIGEASFYRATKFAILWMMNDPYA